MPRSLFGSRSNQHFAFSFNHIELNISSSQTTQGRNILVNLAERALFHNKWFHLDFMDKVNNITGQKLRGEWNNNKAAICLTLRGCTSRGLQPYGGGKQCLEVNENMFFLEGHS